MNSNFMRVMFSMGKLSNRGSDAHRSRKGKPAAMPIFFFLSTVMWLHADTPRPVPVAEVIQVSKSETRSFPGEVRAYRRVDLGFNVSGVMMELNAAEGLRVKAGDILARLDPRDFQFRVDTANAQFELARLELDRKQKLFDEKVISDSQFDQVKTAFRNAEAQRNIAQKALDDSILIAPFDAVVAKRNVENFQQVVAKNAVLTLQDISSIEVKVAVSETLIAHSKLSDVERVSVEFEVERGKWFPAEISEYRIQPDLTTRTYELVLRLPSPDDLNILTGMTANVRIDKKRHPSQTSDGAVMVPIQSIFKAPDGNTCVWVIPSVSGHPEMRVVKVGAPQDTFLQVEKGLNVGELVATAGLHALTASTDVRPSIKNAEGLSQ